VAAAAVVAAAASTGMPGGLRAGDHGTDPGGGPSVRTSEARSVATGESRDGGPRLPLAFEPAGDEGGAAFVARGAGYAVFVRGGSAVLVLRDDAGRTRRVGIGVAAADAAARPAGEERLPGRVHRLVGPADAWRTGVPTFARLRVEEVRPGVDLVWRGHEGRLEYDLVIAPGADPAAVEMEAEPGELGLDGGDLVIRLDGAELRQPAPVVFQTEPDGSRSAVEGRYELRGPGRVGFRVGAYDATRPLVIDPVLVYSTFVGGNGFDEVRGAALDRDGNLYVTGETLSTNFPLTGPFDANGPGSFSESFVVKINPSGTQRIYATYLGGSVEERSYTLAVDRDGQAVLGGHTGSADFPTTPGALSRTLASEDGDGFVTKLNAQGSGLLYSTYLGGDGVDHAIGIALDFAGGIYVTGSTNSTDFPLANAVQSVKRGGVDAIVARLNPFASGAAQLVYSTYLGGAAQDRGWSIAVDAQGRAVAVGTTGSSNFPTANALDAVGNGVQDAFVAKFGPGGALLYSTFLGGDGSEEGFGVALDPAGNAFITGLTDSQTGFVTVNALQPAKAAGLDAFVVKLDPAGSSRLYATFLGGSADDHGDDVDVDRCGRAYVSGTTASPDFPVRLPLQGTNAGGEDAFAAMLSPGGNQLLVSTYFGGAANEQAEGIRVPGCSGDLYVVGTVDSRSFPRTRGALQRRFGGTPSDGFAARIGLDPDGDALTDVVEAAEGRNPAVKDNDVFAPGGPGPRLFAMQQFRDWVNREGLEPGIQFVANQAATIGRAPAIVNLFGTDEVQNEVLPALRLVTAFAIGTGNGIPAADDVLDAVDDVQAGATGFDLAGSFAARASFGSAYGGLGNQNFVRQVFLDLLGREPAQAGLTFYTNQLDAGRPRSDVFAEVALTGEFAERHANRVFVLAVFIEMLGRSPAQAGLDFWIGRLGAGVPRAQLVQQILASAEYRGRFLP
jgi:hypothetical protein